MCIVNIYGAIWADSGQSYSVCNKTPVPQKHGTALNTKCTEQTRQIQWTKYR